MKTAVEIAQHLQEIIANVYLRPAMYGGNVTEVEQALWIYHGTWAYVTDRLGDYFAALADVGAAADCGNMSFNRRYRGLHPAASAHDELQFILDQWGKVTARLGLPVPAEYPEVRHSFPSDKA